MICRICKTADVPLILDLGKQYITSRFPTYGDWSTPKVQISLGQCNQCGLVQLLHTTDSSEIYEQEYGYRSGISNTMRQHLLKYQQEILTFVDLQPGDTVVDIGSNDSTMLQYYPKNVMRIGVDPTGIQFKDYYGDVKLIPTYFTRQNFRDVYSQDVKIVSSISMFYDLPDPVQFAQDIYDILADDGIWTCEQSYLGSMIATNSIDTICHEHLEYYGLKQIKDIADRVGFNIIHVGFNECNGGSFRIYFSKTKPFMDLTYLLKIEETFNLKDFITNVNIQVEKLQYFLQQNAQSTWIYGASTKGNCLLQYANINNLQYAVERNLSKVGKMTSTGIPIISEEEMRKNPPKHLFVLPWHFRNEIIEREYTFLCNGGKLVFPFPEFEIYSLEPKVMITGSSGMIAHYVKKEYPNSYFLDRNYPISFTLDVYKPDIVIHLAGISSSKYCLMEPYEACMANGMMTVELCSQIHKQGLKTRLFNASSSELYKGHGIYHVKEDDLNMMHLHPYAIAKKMGHEMVQFFRHNYGLPFSNGILFTVESYLKSPEFLLNKLANAYRNSEIVTLGPLTSYRNVVHASDVARAIKIILDQTEGSDYLICGNGSYAIFDLVAGLYDTFGENVIIKRDQIVNEDGRVFAYIQQNGRDTMVTDISGDAVKLRELGWETEYLVDDILRDIVN